MLKARLIFPLSELQCRKVLLLSEKCNKRSDFYCLKIKNIPEGLRLAGISESPEPKLGSKWGQSAGFSSWGCSSPAARHFRAPNLLAKHPKKPQSSPGWPTKSSLLQWRRTGMAWVCFPTWWEITPRLFPGIYLQAECEVWSDSKE